jgi:hypothetical protein
MNFTGLVELHIYYEGNITSAKNTSVENMKGMLVIKNVEAFMKSLYLHYKTAVVKIFGLTQRGVTIYIYI